MTEAALSWFLLALLAVVSVLGAVAAEYAYKQGYRDGLIARRIAEPTGRD